MLAFPVRSFDVVAPATATFAAGCFWSAEAAFASLKGVRETAVGYSGGSLENPTFRDICARDTGHAEVVQVTYDPVVVTYGDLLELFAFFSQPRFVRVAECYHFDSGDLCKQPHMLAATAAHTYNRHPDSIARRRLGRSSDKSRSGCERRTSHKISSLH